MPIKLIITADDCGLSQGINDSTGALFDKGIMSSASIMMNYPNVYDAFDYFSSIDGIETGVHLNLTEGEPLSQAALRSDLVRASGRFRNKFSLYAQSVFLPTNIQTAMEIEFRAQIEKYIELSGHAPAHLTTHMHFHVFPAVRDIVYRLATEYGVQWVRNHDFRASLVPMHPLLHKMPKNGKKPRSFFVPDYIAVVKAYLDLPYTLMQNDLLKLDGTVELVVHPSLPKDDQFPHDAIYSPAERNRETVYLEKLMRLLEPYLGNQIEVVNTVSLLHHA
jgi:chitin disaccharide deacetylase